MRTATVLPLITLALIAGAGCDRDTEPGRQVVHALRATPGGVDILTFHGDNARTGWNRRETVLTTANVRSETFGLLANAGEVHGEVPGSPLFASNLSIQDVRTHSTVRADVLFVATMRDHVYALDADDLGVMWDFDFEGRVAPSASDVISCQGPYALGVQSTPVMSPDRTLLYVVGRVTGSSASDTWLQGYALNVRDGSIAGRFRVGETLAADGRTRVPIRIDAVDRGRAISVAFNSNQYSQRSALLLVGNNLYVSTGGFCDIAGFRGWLLAYDVTRLSETAAPSAIWVPTPGGGGGMWSSGGAASDGRTIFAAVGNGRAAYRAGTPDPMRSFADGLARLQPNLTVDTHACFSVASPTAACGAADTANLRNLFMPRHAELLARSNIEDADPDNDLGGPDEDFGSSGPMLVPAAELPENAATDMGRSLVAMGGKDGMFYLVDRDRMGGIGPSPLVMETDIPNLVGSELWSQELFRHSTSGGILSTAAYFEGHSGRYMFIVGADEIGGRADSPRGLAGLRLRAVTDPTPAECAAQFREIAYHTTSLPCATIWGSTPRPGLELAWSGTDPTNGATPYVSSNGNANGIVWVTFERNSEGYGVLEAFPAESAPGTGHVVAPIYRSDRLRADRPPAQFSTFSAPIVANGRVYTTGQSVSMYGLLPAARALPDLPEPMPPPDCAPGVSWESTGRTFMTRYCTSCHAEYLDIGFIQRRRERVARSILPSMGDPPIMPLIRDRMMPPPLPTDAERTTMAAWLRCGAPASFARLHAGFATIAAAGGAFVGDGDSLDVNRTGTLSADRLTGAMLTNGLAPAIPSALFATDRTGPTRYRIAVPGAGRYGVTLYFAENACTTGGAECNLPFDVALAGTPWLSRFSIATAAGGARRVVSQTTTVNLTATSQLLVDVSAMGKVNALEVSRRDTCTADTDCVPAFTCAAGACVPIIPDAGYPDTGPTSFDAGGSADAFIVDDSQTETGGPTDDGSVSRFDAGSASADARNDARVADTTDSGPARNSNCTCRAAGAPTPSGHGLLAGAAMALAVVARRRRVSRHR